MDKLKLSYFKTTILLSVLMLPCNSSNAVPPNSHVLENGSWQCDDGFKKQGQQCNPIYIPPNAHLKGNSWLCNSGYLKKGNQCNASKKSPKPELINEKPDAEQLNRAGEFYNSLNYQKAFPIYKMLASRGNAQAQFMLSGMHSGDYGLPNDEEKSVYWLKKSASQGNLNALHYLGQRYETGRGVLKDPIKAKLMYRKAADIQEIKAKAGDYVSQAMLGLSYCQGSLLYGGTRKKDLVKCAYWLRKAHENGAYIKGIKPTWEKYQLWKY